MKYDIKAPLNCPRCKSDNIVDLLNDQLHFLVYCEDCGLESDDTYRSEGDAYRHWNDFVMNWGKLLVNDKIDESVLINTVESFKSLSTREYFNQQVGKCQYCGSPIYGTLILYGPKPNVKFTCGCNHDIYIE